MAAGPLTIPNTASGATAEQLAQGAPDSLDYSILAYGDAGVGVITGCVVSAQSSPNATVQVSAGMVSVGNAGYAVGSVASLTIGANVSGNPRFDLVIYRVGVGVMVLAGTPGVAPYTAFPAITFTTDIALAAIYVANGFSTITNSEIISKQATVQPAPMGAAPSLGGKMIGLGHSFMEGYGAVPTHHGFMGQIAGMARSRLWNMGVGGAKLAGCFGPGVNGYGGIPQVLQQYVPPKQPMFWRGAYSASTYYNLDDGVTNAPAAISCTTNGTTALTSAALFGAAYVAGMVISGTNIKPGTYVVSVNSTSSITLNQVATGSGTQNLTFTGWYRCAATTFNVAPAGVGNGANWYLIPAGNVGYSGSPWNAQSSLPVIMFGQNDITQLYQRSTQPFLSSFQAMCCRIASAMVWEDTSPMVTLAGGTFTNFTYVTLGAAFGSGTSLSTIPNTAAATISCFTPPDWPGGFVDMGFVMLTGSTMAGGTMTFAVDGVAATCKCSGMADGSSVNFGSPNRQPILGCALGTALTSGISSGVTLTLRTPLPVAVGSGSSIVVGGVGGGTSQTFVTTISALAGAVSLTVTAQVANATYPVGTPVYDSTPADQWQGATDIVVRVPVAAGCHQVVATVPASPSIANLAFDYVSFEAPVQPIGVVLGVWKPVNLAVMGFTCPTYQDIDTWNTAIQGVLGTGNEWPHVFTNVADVLMNTSAITTALTLGQAGVTSLAVTAGIKFSVAAGDTIQVGSGATVQLVTASAPQVIGATSIAVTSFTSTYAQPIGSPVANYTVASKNFYSDGVHPNVTGHSQMASVVWQAILNSLQTIPQLVAVQSESIGRPTCVVSTIGSADIVNGSATSAAAWVISGAGYVSVAAVPGDIIEVEVNGLWDTSTTVTGYLDIATWNPATYGAGNSAGVAAVINYVSGVKSMGGPYTNLGLEYDSVGAQAASGLSALLSPPNSGGVQDRIVGKFKYPVQTADIIGGFVSFCIVGASSTTTVRHIKNIAGYQFMMSATNVGPLSYASEA